LDESKTYVYDATDLVMGRLASIVAKQLFSGARAGEETRVIIVNAEMAVISGKKDSVINEYLERYRLNHARKGPFFPRMPDLIMKRSVRGMLPYQRKPSARTAFRALRVEIGCPSHLKEGLPDGHSKGDDSKIRRALPHKFVRLGDISTALGAPTHRWNGGDV
jgi:large subunit ribosomal protein L13